jgi:hypothetical protein
MPACTPSCATPASAPDAVLRAPLDLRRRLLPCAWLAPVASAATATAGATAGGAAAAKRTTRLTGGTARPPAPRPSASPPPPPPPPLTAAESWRCDASEGRLPARAAAGVGNGACGVPGAVTPACAPSCAAPASAPDAVLSGPLDLRRRLPPCASLAPVASAAAATAGAGGTAGGAAAAAGRTARLAGGTARAPAARPSACSASSPAVSGRPMAAEATCAPLVPCPRAPPDEPAGLGRRGAAPSRMPSAADVRPPDAPPSLGRGRLWPTDAMGGPWPRSREWGHLVGRLPHRRYAVGTRHTTHARTARESNVREQVVQSLRRATSDAQTPARAPVR